MAIFDVVFSSGGTKGIAFAGCAEVLVQKGHTLRRLIGTSAGAISVTLLACGYDSQQILKLLQGDKGVSPFAGFIRPPDAAEVLEAVRREDSETRQLLRQGIIRAIDKYMETLTEKAPRISAGLKVAIGLIGRGELYDKAFDAFFDVRPEARSTIVPILSFLEFGGFFTIDPVTDWLTKQIQVKIPAFRPDWTLLRFAQATNRDISVITADTSEKTALVLNHRTAPDCPLIQAVKMSMSIPMVWPEVAWQADWGKYLGAVKTGHFCVDGAAILNLPMRLFVDADNPKVKQIMGDPPAPVGHPLGLLLDDTLPVPGDIEPLKKSASKLIERAERLIDTVTRWEDELAKKYESVICRIPTFGYSALEFASSSARMDTLINSGRCAMLEYLQKRKFD